MSNSREHITSISKAIRTLVKLESSRLYTKGEAEIHKYPFGLWFRGHSRLGLKLEPRVFRDRLSERERAIVQVGSPGGERGRWEESNVYDHLRLRVPVHEHIYHSAFDWLCLMQHYSVPTRLLDWSESILPALYFAVKDDKDCDGEVIVLNAYRLNILSKGRTNVAIPDEYHVVIRSEMATTRSAKRLREKDKVTGALGLESAEERVGSDWTNFLKPIAVFPRRLNERMTLQSSVFTIHGGKYYVPATRRLYEKRNDIIPEPVSLESIDRSQPARPILRRYIISKNDKSRIRNELFLMGIHEGTLFPEIDRQAVYLQDCWWYGDEPSAAGPQ